MSKDLEELRKEAHEAPLNTVLERHTGERFLGSHSRAWADAANRYVEALNKEKK